MSERTMAATTGKVLLGLALLLHHPAARAADTCPAPPAAVQLSVESATDAFSKMDEQAFKAAYSNLAEQVTCLSVPPDPEMASSVHRVEALAAFLANDDANTRKALQAMYESDPRASIPEALAPKGGLLSSLESEARAAPPATRAQHGVPFTVYVDGEIADDLPLGQPSLVYVVDSSGQMRWSGLVPPGGSIPTLVQSGTGIANQTAATPAPPIGKDDPPKQQSKLAKPVLIAAGGTALVAGVFGGLYVPAKGRVETAQTLIRTEAPDSDWDEAFGATLTSEEILSLRSNARGLEVATQVAGGVALGLGAIGLVLVW